MDTAIQFLNVVANDEKMRFSFSVPGGCMAALLSLRQDEADLIVRLALGLSKPASGDVITVGENVGALNGKMLSELRTRVAVVHYSGGLLSNLNIWENLTLPLEYHSNLPQSLIRERGLAVLNKAGFPGKLVDLPGHLRLYEKRLLGMARAMLTEPQLIIYNNTLEGISDEERSSIIALANEFHLEQPGRTSLFMASSQESVKGMDFERRIIMKGSEIHD